MWLVGLILFWSVLLLLVATLQSSRGEAMVASGTCPDCRVPMQHIHPDPTEQPPRAWEVLACPTCTRTVAVVQGIPSSSAWCPRCRQRAMELKPARLAPEEDAPIRVAVDETCHLCTHRANVVVEHRVGGPRGKVIPFPNGTD